MPYVIPPTDDLRAPIEIRNDCVIDAAAYYGVPPEVVILLRVKEAGRLGAVSVNKNKSIDSGPMQVNSIHQGDLSKVGITKELLRDDECVNIYAGTWVFATKLAATPRDIWKAIGNYNSANEPHHSKYLGEAATLFRRLKVKFKPYFEWLRRNAEAKRAQQIQSGERVSYMILAKPEVEARSLPGPAMTVRR